MKILSFTSCFPSVADPVRGTFIRDRLAALAKLVPLEVVHSCAWFPVYGGNLPIGPDGEETVDGLKVHHRRFFYLPGLWRGAGGRLYGRSVGRWLERHLRTSPRPDLLDAHFAWPDGVGISHVAARLGIPFVVTLRGEANFRLGHASMREQIARALGQAAAVISLSEPIARICTEELGVDAAKIAVIPNGVDLETFRPMPAAEARQALGLDARGRYIVSIAHLLPDKGMTQLVQAVGQLPADVRCLIVGGDMDGGAYRRSLERLARRGGVGDRVTFTGMQDRSKIPLYLNAADVSVLASYAEGCPNVVLESLACGRPVVATAVGQTPRMVLPGQNGLLVAPRDASALAGAIQEALRRSWSGQVIRTSSSVCPWEAVAARTLEILRAVPCRA